MNSVKDAYYSSDEDVDVFSPAKSHPPVSPATGAESLFLAGLTTSTISANALAQTLKQNHYNMNNRSTVSSAYSVQTDDFATAVESPDDLEDDNSYSAFGKDALVYSRDIIPELENDSDTESVTTTDKMAKNKKSNTTTSKAGTTDSEQHPDAASHLYEGVKGAWAWGKTLPVVTTFMGIGEAIASKVVGIAGTDFEEIDTQLKPHLTQFDIGVLNPALEAIIGALLGAAGKSEEFIKPIIHLLLNPLSLIKKEPENKTSVVLKVPETPELTTKPAPVVAVK
jgi:hypothetical protein